MKKGARLGQHFLKHGWAARALAHAANPDFAETIVEIGPGKGILTKELLAFGNPVIAIEKDEALVTHLQNEFAEQIADGQLTLVAGDVRDTTPKTLGLEESAYIIAANIPYYITGEIIRQFLTAEKKPRAMALLVQKEVAQRITDTKSSILSLSVRAYGTPSIIKKVPKSHFSPPPSVDSAILLIDDISSDFFPDISEAAFFQVVHAGFSSKRKFLANNLSNLFPKKLVQEAFTACLIDEKARAEDLSIEAWHILTHSLTR